MPEPNENMVEVKLPKTLGACADLLYKLREERRAIEKKADEVAKKERFVKNYLINTLPKSEASGIAGKIANVKITTKQVPQVEDWAAFYKFVKRTGEFEFLHKRISSEAIRERWEAGKTIPGVTHFTVIDVSLTKV